MDMNFGGVAKHFCEHQGNRSHSIVTYGQVERGIKYPTFIDISDYLRDGQHKQSKEAALTASGYCLDYTQASACIPMQASPDCSRDHVYLAVLA